MGNLQDKFFRKYSGALIFTVFPHEKVQIDDDLLRRQVIESKSLFGRYYTVNQENTYGG